MILLISACAAWLVFRRMGHNITGGAIPIGMFLLGVGFGFVGYSTEMAMTRQDLLSTLIVVDVGRALQCIGGTFLALGFYYYFRLSSRK